MLSWNRTHAITHFIMAGSCLHSLLYSSCKRVKILSRKCSSSFILVMRASCCSIASLHNPAVVLDDLEDIIRKYNKFRSYIQMIQNGQTKWKIRQMKLQNKPDTSSTISALNLILSPYPYDYTRKLPHLYSGALLYISISFTIQRSCFIAPPPLRKTVLSPLFLN